MRVRVRPSLMRYGFLIDQDRCIGCHACTVACKEEHNVRPAPEAFYLTPPK